ncbi:hypothetical protein ACSHWB_35300 [Lentzea sp. HUAS TT2]|uniref:hypothetical protein n=1 Tax=Lentzea sp. HUAS TT2 TaxID=3447454 RepID=UPI003F728054
MNAVLPPPDLVDWAHAEVGPILHATSLSTSNSRVWKASSASGDWVLKHLDDRSSTPEVESFVLAQLRDRPDVRQIRALMPCADGSTYLIAEYVTGRTLDECLGTAKPAAAAGWAGQLDDLVEAVARIPVTGYGKVRLGPDGLCAENDSWPEFLGDYLEGQRVKAPRLAGLRHDRLRRALRAFHTGLVAAAPVPRLVPADVNLRNFVAGPSGLVCCNIPVLWAGDPDAARGEALLHWAGTAGEPVLRSESPLLHFYAAFHAYVILAYVERFSPEPLDRATPWGCDTPLLQLLDEHLLAAEGA